MVRPRPSKGPGSRSSLALGEAEASKRLAFRVVETAKAKKALKIVVLEMREASSLCDYFVILSGTSLRHVNALAQHIEADLDKDRIRSLSKVSPNDESGWVVLDYSSVIIHIFFKPMREFYSLERLWRAAKRVRVPRKTLPLK